MTTIPDPQTAEAPESPSLAWVADLDADDQADFFQDVRRAAATYNLAALIKAMSTYWVIAMGTRAQQDAPGPNTAQHGLPVVDQAAVTAALGKTVVGAALANSVAKAAECDNCHGPGPLVPHVHGMRVCQACFPEPDAFAFAAESALAAQDGGEGRG